MTDLVIRTHADYQKYNFFCTPDWRWERVLSMVDRPGRPPGRTTKRDDAVVKTARSFVIRYENGDGDDRRKLMFENPGLCMAYEFYLKLVDDPESSMYLQARVLAKQDPEHIFEATGLPPQALKWYCDLFFDVQARLGQRDWITKQVLIPAMLRTTQGPKILGAQPDDEEADPEERKLGIVARPFLDGTLKLFAYFGGPHVIDVMIHGMQTGMPLNSRDDFPTWIDGVWKQSFRARSAQAVKLFQINKYNVMEIFNIHTKIMEIERSEENQSKEKNVMERHISTMIDDIPWAVGQDAEVVYDNTMVGRFDKMAPELRDAEMIQVASGRSAPTIADNFPAQLPPPRKTKKGMILNADTEF